MKISNPHFIYRNMFGLYSIAIISIVLILEINFIVEIKNQIRNNNLYYQQLLCREVANEMNTMEEQVNEISKQLYSSNSENELKDLINYLQMEQDEYLKQSLDSYSASNKTAFDGMNSFIKEIFGVNNQISNISVLSFKYKKITTYSQKGSQINISSIIFENKENEMIWVEKNKITFGIEIHELNNIIIEDKIGDLKYPGILLITFDVGNIEESYKYYNRGELIILKDTENVLYCSNYIEDIKNSLFLNNIFIGQEIINKKLKLQTSVEKVNGFYIISYMNKIKASAIPPVLWITLLTAGMILFVIGEIFVSFHLKKLANRLEVILSAMKQVKEGNLNVEIKTSQKKDELDIIGQNFNKMCADLKLYIEKSYLAEIAQKNAEISALQSQINPHFLYNTLESIRMKAITNGDREVAKMLYGLAVVFRSQIKDSKIITVAKELYYCKKYLELFEFRYQNKFRFEMICPENFLEKSILKFSVQPIIENYFIHGIRNEDNDNILHIEVKQNEKDMLILVDDNGKGMSKEKIEIKNKELEQNKECTNSIGISNVHLRMTAEYGKGYGVRLEKKEEKGLLVILRFPY